MFPCVRQAFVVLDSPKMLSNKTCSLPCRTSIIFGFSMVVIIGFIPRGQISVKLDSTNEKLGTGHKEYLPNLGTTHVGMLNSDGNSSSVVIADAPSHRVLSRHRRSVLQLASMLKCVTGCSPLAFHGYGCFCGYMGDGAPVDPIDTCCLEHDWCYSATRCSHLSTYLLPYHWSCAGPGIAFCSLTDSLSPHHGCAQQLCECDLQFARCISRYPCPAYRPSCHHGGRSLIRDVLNGKAALQGWRIQHSDPLAVGHLVDHILKDEDDGKEVKRKSKKKITLSAGVHRDPFSTSFFPNLHANVQFENDNEEAKQKIPDKKIVIVGHDPTLDVGSIIPAALPGSSVTPDLAIGGLPTFGGAGFGSGGEDFGTGVGNPGDSHPGSTGGFGQSGSSGGASSHGHPGFPSNPEFPGNTDFQGGGAQFPAGSSPNENSGSASPGVFPGNSGFPGGAAGGSGFQGGFGAGGGVGATAGFGGSGFPPYNNPNIGEGFGVGGQTVQTHETENAVVKKEPITQKAPMSAGHEKKSEKLVAESKIAPKFDKVFRHDVDVALYLRTSPRPSNNRFAGLSQGWFSRYYESIAKLANRNFTRVFELNAPQGKPLRLGHQKRKDAVALASDNSSTGSQVASHRKKHNQYYDDVGTGVGTKKYDIDRITYGVENPFAEKSKTSKLVFPGPSRP